MLAVTKKKYDPIENGADCPNCVLYGLPVVPPSGNPHSTVAFVAQNPGIDEVNHVPPMPLVGRSGRLYNETLQHAGISRPEVWTTNAILCPSRNEAGKDVDPPPQAIKCCRPRLARELANKKIIVCMGQKALHAVAPDSFIATTVKKHTIRLKGGKIEVRREVQHHQRKITSVFGYAERDKGRWIMPVGHPAFILRPDGRAFLDLFIHTFKRVKRIIDGKFAHQIPVVKIACDLSAIREFISHARHGGMRAGVVLDVETTKDHPLAAKLKCIGLSCACTWCVLDTQLGRHPFNVVIPFINYDPDMPSRFWSKADEKKVRVLLNDLIRR